MSCGARKIREKKGGSNKGGRIPLTDNKKRAMGDEKRVCDRLQKKPPTYDLVPRKSKKSTF